LKKIAKVLQQQNIKFNIARCFYNKLSVCSAVMYCVFDTKTYHAEISYKFCFLLSCTKVVDCFRLLFILLLYRIHIKRLCRERMFRRNQRI